MTMAISQCPGSVRHTLTPIVNFNSGDVFSFEIKQRILKNNGSVLNNHSDERMSFMRQLEFFQKLNRQDALSYRGLFIDAAAREGANKSYGTRAFTGNPLILND